MLGKKGFFLFFSFFDFLPLACSASLYILNIPAQECTTYSGLDLTTSINNKKQNKTNYPIDKYTGQYVDVIPQVRFDFPRYVMQTSKDSDDNILIRIKFDPLSFTLHKNLMGRKRIKDLKP